MWRVGAVVVALALVGPPVITAQQSAPAPRSSTVPPDWTATFERMMELARTGKHEEWVALAEAVVAKYPGFADGHSALGGAHEDAARQLMRTDPQRARSRFEMAATHLRRAFELGGEHPGTTIRGLIDLYDYALPSSTVWKATILDAVKRYPTVPEAHWYFLQLLLREGRIPEIDAALLSARKALPQAPETRLDFANLLVGLAEKASSPMVRAKFSTEALAFANEVLKTHPTGSFARRAAALKEQVSLLPEGAVVPSQLPPSDESGARSTLLAITSGQIAYAVECGFFYAPTLAALAKPPGLQNGFINAFLAPTGNASVLERYGYRIEMTATPSPKSPRCNGQPAGASSVTFAVTARPMPGFSGRSFRIDANGSLTVIK